MPKHKSDSSAQQDAEATMLSALERELGADFSALPTIDGHPYLRPDAIDFDKKIVVEAFARVGKLKPAQCDKVKGDVLKLIYITRLLGSQWRGILCFASDEAAKYVLGRGWVASAVREFGFEVSVVNLPSETIESIEAAQTRQVMVNAP